MPPSAISRWWRGRGGVALLLLSSGVAAGADLFPRTEDALVATVRTAIADRDMETFERLINWEGASPIKQRIVRFEVRRGLGRPIRTIRLEPFPENGLREIEARGILTANMPVSHRLRVVYDEPLMEDFAISPTAVFLIGRKGDAFRIALVVRAEKDND